MNQVGHPCALVRQLRGESGRGIWLCGVKVEEIAEPLMQNIRYLDKLVKGKSMDQILRKDWVR